MSRARENRAFLRAFFKLDAAWAAAGVPPLSPFFRDTLTDFYMSDALTMILSGGRRLGKSLTATKLGVASALLQPWTVGPGERGVVSYTSVDRDEAGGRLLQGETLLNILGEEHVRRGDVIELTSRPCEIRVLTATTAGVIGRTIVFACCDEVARWKDAASGRNPVKEIVATMTPAMATIPSARLLLFSTPWSTADYFASRVELGNTASQRVYSAPTWVGNPSVSEADTHRLEGDPRVWAREYAGRPVDAVGVVATSAELDAVTSQAQSLPYAPGTVYGLVADLGLQRDATAAIVFHHELRETEGVAKLVLVIDEVLHLKPSFLKPVKLATAVDEIAKLARRFNVTKVRADNHYSQAVAPALAERGVTLEVLPMASPAITARVESLQAKIQEGAIELVRHEGLRKELSEAQLVAHAGGRLTLKAPEGRGRHDDLVSALLLACDGPTFGKLPPGGAGGIVVKYRPVTFTPGEGVGGGGADYFRRGPGGVLLPCEPPYGTRAFEDYARGEIRSGRWTRQIERFVRERYGVEPRPDLDLDVLEDEQRRGGGFVVPVIHD